MSNHMCTGEHQRIRDRVIRGRITGSTLLLALLILGSVVAASVAGATILARRLADARTTDAAVLASYAAESGIEDLLYAIRRRGQLTALDGTGALANGATWTRRVAATVPEIFLTVPRDDAAQVDLFDPSGHLAAVGVRTLLVTPTALDPRAWLEVTWVPWLMNAQQWAPEVARRLFGPSDLALDRPVLVDLAAEPFGDEPVAYRVRFRVVGAPAGASPASLRVQAARDADGRERVDFPSRIRATVVGASGGARQAYAVEVAPRAPLLPFFDYVLFSACDIVKGGTITCPSGS